MAWKRKQPEMSLEQALALATEEVMPHWHNSKPLVISVKKEDSFLAVPLLIDFEQKNWLISFIDVTSAKGHWTLKVLTEWYNRYKENGIEILAILTISEQNILDRFNLGEWIRKKAYRFPIVHDHDGTLKKALDPQSNDFFKLFESNKLVFETDDPIQFENSIQNFLRKKDPGLPLLYTIGPEFKIHPDIERIKLSHEANPAVSHSGRWEFTENYWETKDNLAELVFKIQSTQLYIIAATNGLEGGSAEIHIDVKNRAVSPAQVGDDLRINDDDRSLFSVDIPRLYHVIKNLTNEPTTIKLRFPKAEHNPVRVYTFIY